MIDAGIVAVGDICNTVDSATIKASGNLNYYNFIELLGWSPAQAASRYKTGMETAAFFLEKIHDENHLSLNPHAPYSVSPELWELMIPGFAGKTITIHNQESAAENDFFKTGGGDLRKMYFRMKIDNTHFKAPGTRSLPAYLNRLKNALAYFARTQYLYGRIRSGHSSFLSRAVVFLPLPPGQHVYRKQVAGYPGVYEA